MSYDIFLKDPVTGSRLQLQEPHHMRGGTYAIGGTTDAELNVTYNYAKHFGGLGDRGIRSLYGSSGADSIPLMESVIAQLGDDVSDDYWEATEGNAKRALMQLVALAKMLPHGIWDGD